MAKFQCQHELKVKENNKINYCKIFRNVLRSKFLRQADKNNINDYKYFKMF